MIKNEKVDNYSVLDLVGQYIYIVFIQLHWKIYELICSAAILPGGAAILLVPRFQSGRFDIIAEVTGERS
jgi:hypothetical protein